MAVLTGTSSSWENVAQRPVISMGVLVLDEDGDWAFDDDPNAVADGVMVTDDDGDLAADDEATEGLRLLQVRDDILAIPEA